MHRLGVPPAFGKPVLARLKPRNHPKQPAIIQALKANPEGSYVFTGANGCGKTHFCWALCRAALVRGNRVRPFLLSELLSAYRNFEIDPESAVRPILPGDLREGNSYTIFLDEFEKARTSEFATRKLFELLNAVRDFKHQLLVTSNKPWAELQRIWSDVDDVYGSSIMTRLEQCTLVEMF